MKKTLSVLMGVFLVALLLGCSGVVGDAEYFADASRGTSSASSLSTGTISSNTTYGDFTLLATSEKL